MADLNQNGNPPSVAALVGGLIDDTQRLVRQEVALARRQVVDEWDKTKIAVALLGSAAGVFGMANVLFGFMLVKLLQEYMLPRHEWACFAIVGALFALGGGLLAAAGLSKFKQVRLVPQQSVDSIRQDVQAVGDAVTGDRATTGELVKQ